MKMRQARFYNRIGLASLLNSKDLATAVVEVGTHRGQFAAEFLNHWRGTRFYCVDDWQVHPGAEGDREVDFIYARRLLTPHAGRVTIIRDTSEKASWLFGDEVLDMAYIDACHQYEAVKHDIALWWRKVKPGGLLAGHDFMCQQLDDGWTPQVQQAVMEFCTAGNLTLFLVVEMNGHWSWYVEK